MPEINFRNIWHNVKKYARIQSKQTMKLQLKTFSQNKPMANPSTLQQREVGTNVLNSKVVLKFAGS